MSVPEDIRKEAEALNAKYQTIQTNMTSIQTNIRANEVAKNENTTVQSELESLKEGQKVYKLVGPVLIRVDIDEAKTNVENRLKLLERQSNDLKEQLKKEETDYKTVEDEVIKLQQKAAMNKVNSLPKK